MAGNNGEHDFSPGKISTYVVLIYMYSSNSPRIFDSFWYQVSVNLLVLRHLASLGARFG